MMKKTIIALLCIFLVGCSLNPAEEKSVLEPDTLDVPDIDVSSDHYFVRIEEGGSSAAAGRNTITYYEVNEGEIVAGNVSTKYNSPGTNYNCVGQYSTDNITNGCWTYICDGDAPEFSTYCERLSPEDILLNKLEGEYVLPDGPIENQSLEKKYDLSEVRQAIEAGESICFTLSTTEYGDEDMCIKQGHIVSYQIPGRGYYKWERIVS